MGKRLRVKSLWVKSNIGEKSVGEKSLGENRGRWDAGFRSPLLRFLVFLQWKDRVIKTVWAKSTESSSVDVGMRRPCDVKKLAIVLAMDASGHFRDEPTI